MIALYIILGILGAIAGLVLINALFICSLSLFVRNKEYEKPSDLYLWAINFYFRIVFFLCHIKIVVTGKEKIDKIGDTFLLVGNHRSNFDPFITAVALRKKRLAFISKPENFKIPIFGKIARKSLYMEIDRQNARNAIKTINRTAELIKSGVVSYAVYPEGTRSKGVNMLPFHDGVFKIAEKAESPVLVVGIRGTENIHNNAPWKKTVVNLDILEVIEPEQFKSLSSHELSAMAREKIYLATENR